MDDVKQKNPPAKIVGESFSALLTQSDVSQAELDARYAIYSKTIHVQWGLVAAGAYYNLGVIDLLRKDYQSARSNFKQALELDPNDKKARQNLDYIEGKSKTFVKTFHQTLDTYKNINANSVERPVVSAN